MGRADRRASPVVRLKSVEGYWTTVGGENDRGIMPEQLVASANEAGPDTASFALKRRASVEWPDLTAFNQAEIEVGGIRVWGGRVWEAPLSDTGEDSIAVAGRGWQYHLDDDLIDRYYVQTDLAAWRDSRSLPAMNIAVMRANGDVQVGQGIATFGWRLGTSIVNATGVGITIDLGPNRTAKRIVVTFDAQNPNAFATIYARSHSTSDAHSGSSSDAFATSFGTIASPVAGTFATGYRYVTLMMYRTDGLTTTSTTDHVFRALSIKIFADTAYESGNASILKADQVIKDARAQGCPLLDTSDALISAGAFSIPDLAPGGYSTPRQIMAAANAYEGNLLGVDLDRRIFFRERATIPTIEVGSWSGAQFRDASTNSGEGLYSRVVVQGVGPDGSPIAEVRTAAASLLARQGFDRTATLSVGAPMTTASAQALGDIWLAERATPPLKGTLTVTGHGGARYVTGGGLHPAELLLRVGERIRLSHLVDPADGAFGRDGTIRSVSYSHDDQTATVELDNERGSLEAFLQRLEVVTTQAVR